MRIAVGPLCRGGLRGVPRTECETTIKLNLISCSNLHTRFALRRKSFPAERTYFDNFPKQRPLRDHADCEFRRQVEWRSGFPVGVVADFGRSSLPRRTSRPAAICVHVNQGSGPISCRVLHTGFAFRRKSFPAERTYFDNHPRLHPFPVEGRPFSRTPQAIRVGIFRNRR